MLNQLQYFNCYKCKSPGFRLNPRAFSSVVDKSNEVVQSKIFVS